MALSLLLFCFRPKKCVTSVRKYSTYLLAVHLFVRFTAFARFIVERNFIVIETFVESTVSIFYSEGINSSW